MKARDLRKGRILRILATLYIVASFFGIWGYLAGRYFIFPGRTVDGIVVHVRKFLEGGEGEAPKSNFDRLVLHRQEMRNPFDFSGFVKRDAAFVDSGYILLPHFSSHNDQAITELIRLQDFTVVHRWIPDLSDMNENGAVPFGDTMDAFKMSHPWLLPDGSLVFMVGTGPLVRIDRNSRLLWVTSSQNAEHFHHSIERGGDGNFYVPMELGETTTDGKKRVASPQMIEHGYCVVSPDGEILDERLLRDIFIDNDEYGILLGVGRVEEDRYHLNDVQPILDTSGIATEGDLFMCIRNLGAMLLYRPSNNKIVHLRIGPWLNAHDIDQLPDGRFSIFDNNLMRYLSPRDCRYEQTERREHPPGDTCSLIKIWDPVSGSVSSPYRDVLRKHGMSTLSEGLARVLPNGDVFIEDSTSARLLRISPEKVRWEFVSPSNDRKDVIQHLHWCRYLMPTEINPFWLNEEE